MAGTPQKPALKITAAERPNTLGLGQRELEVLLSKMEAADNKNKAPVRREFSRWPFRQATIRVTLIHPTGAEASLKLACRNLSRGGVSLLHNQFIHPGSQVVVSLPRLSGGAKDVLGSVKRCVHKKLTLHEVGVQFEEQIDLREFLGAGKGTEFYSLEHIEPEKLHGQILYVEDSDIDYKVFQHFIRETSLVMSRAKCGVEAMELSVNPVDLIICDWKLGDMTGTELISRLRDNAITTPVLLVTADPVGLMREGVWESLNSGLLTKPLAQQQLLRSIAERLLVRSTDASTQHTAEHQDPDAATVVAQRMPEAYVELFQKLAATIEQHLEKQEHREVSDICMQIRGSAPSCGAPTLARLADQTLTSLAHANSLPQGVRFAKELISACRRLQAA